jgi:hypothetical protein
MLSRTMSSRSGNRGECSQPCRLTYDLIDSNGRKLRSGKHLLSVRDLDLSSHIGELIDDGICSFKVEGRLKDISYIKNVVAHYRRRIDEELASRPEVRRSSVGVSAPDFVPDPAKSFTRGESSYMFEGKRAGVASFDTPKAVGEYVGRVARVDGRTFTLDRTAELAAGDGLCFIADGALTGTNINLGYENLSKSFSSNITVEQYIEKLKEQVKDVPGMTYSFSDKTDSIKLGNTEFKRVIAEVKATGITMEQAYYLRKADGYMSFIIVTITKGYTVSDIEAMFK